MVGDSLECSIKSHKGAPLIVVLQFKIMEDTHNGSRFAEDNAKTNQFEGFSTFDGCIIIFNWRFFKKVPVASQVDAMTHHNKHSNIKSEEDFEEISPRKAPEES